MTARFTALAGDHSAASQFFQTERRRFDARASTGRDLVDTMNRNPIVFIALWRTGPDACSLGGWRRKSGGWRGWRTPSAAPGLRRLPTPLSKLVVGRPLRARRPPFDSDRQPPGLTAAIEDVLVKVVAGPQLHCRTRPTHW